MRSVSRLVAVTTLLLGTLLAVAPGPAAAATSWLQVSAGGDHTCGIRTNHTLWCWGQNLRGELGLGDHTDRYVPAQVGSQANWASVSSGLWFTCGVKSDGTAYCWGENDWGQLGVGDYAKRDRPTPLLDQGAWL